MNFLKKLFTNETTPAGPSDIVGLRRGVIIEVTPELYAQIQAEKAAHPRTRCACSPENCTAFQGIECFKNAATGQELDAMFNATETGFPNASGFTPGGYRCEKFANGFVLQNAELEWARVKNEKGW